jgi:hypothetical protein
MNYFKLGQGIQKALVRFGGAVVLAGALVAMAPAGARGQSVSVRVYDSHHHDYHNWDDREDRSYRRYVAERHWQYREYQRQSSRRQRAYWEWRHSHPD